MTEIGKASARDVDGGADGGEDQNERVDGRGSGLVADRNYVFLGICGEGRFLLVDGKERALLKVRWGDGGGVCGVCAKWTRRQERNGDREL